MQKMTQEEYENLYKIVTSASNKMTFHDASETASTFNDDKYFTFGIYTDILISAQSMLLNILLDNKESAGIDNNCRTILEGLTILDMNDKGEISADRKKLYRLSWAPIEYYNNKKTFDEIPVVRPDVAQQQGYILRENTINEFCNLANGIMPNANLNKNLNYIGFPDLYLRDKPNGNLDYVSLLKKHNIGIPNAGKMYSFFTILIHPWAETDNTKLNKIMTKRSEYIDIILNRVSNFIQERSIPFDVNEVVVKTRDELIGNDKIPNYFSYFDCVIDAVRRNNAIPTNLYEQLKCLIWDLYYCGKINENRSAIIKFKSIIERVASILAIESNPTNKEMFHRTFVYGTRLRLYRLSLVSKKHLSSNLEPSLETNLRDSYDNYYKSTYGLDNNGDFDEFITKLVAKFYYPFYLPPDKNHDKIDIFVNTFLPIEFNSSPVGNTTFSFLETMQNCYKKSLDMEHTTGYSYNMSDYTVKLFFIETLGCCCEIIYKFFERYCKEDTLKHYIITTFYMGILVEYAKVLVQLEEIAGQDSEDTTRT